MGFDINSKTLFLTYSQATINRDDLHTFLRSKLCIQYACIATEQHADSHEHAHAALKLSKRTRIRDCRKLDYQGFHPSIESARNWDATLNYVKKDGKYTEYGTMESDIHGQRGGGLTIRSGESYLEYLGRCNQESINI